MHSFRFGRARAGLGLAAALAVATAGACSNMLDVSNPGAIQTGDLENAQMEPAIVNGAIGEFQPAFDGIDFYGGVFTDELVDRQTFMDDRPIDLRDVDPSNSLINVYAYVPMQRARGAADHGVDLLQQMYGDKAGSTMDVARLYDYAGYSIVYLADTFCSAPIDVSRAYSPSELYQMAIDRFNKAITVAAAAKAAGGNAASADSLTHLANLGIARAALDMNDKTTALARAKLVPAGFEFWVNHSDNSSRENNFIYDAVRPNNQYVSYDPSFQGLDDPRIPQDSVAIEVPFNKGAFIYMPYQTEQYSGWQPGQLIPIAKGTAIRFASGLEAQYIVAEAQGPTQATLDFVNARRAVGNQPAVDLSGEALMAELREQRRRDLFLAGYRMGDLRRYKQFDGVDGFPTGAWPGGGGVSYGTQTCWPIPTSEVNSNPNLGH